MKVGDVWVYRDHVYFLQHKIIEDMGGYAITKIFYKDGYDFVRLRRLEDNLEMDVTKENLLEEYVDIRDANEFLQQ